MSQQIVLEFFYDKMRHLVCKPYSVQNLHVMASQLNIKRCWFHNSKNHPHYDVPKRMMSSIGERATLITPREMISIMKSLTEKKS